MGVGPDLVTPSVGYDQSKSYERAFSRIQWRFALRSRLHPVQFKRHFDESRFYSVKSIRSSHKAKKPYGISLVQFGQSRHKSKLSAPRAILQVLHRSGAVISSPHLSSSSGSFQARFSFYQAGFLGFRQLVTVWPSSARDAQIQDFIGMTCELPHFGAIVCVCARTPL